MARYVCERECTFRAPGEGYDRVYVRGEHLELPDDYKGREALDKNKKKILIPIPRHFRKLKAREQVEDDVPEVSDDAMDRALSGEPVAMSELGKQTVAPDGSDTKKRQK